MSQSRPLTSGAARSGVEATSATTLASPGARARILAAADDLFYRRGVRNVGIDEIIAVAGVAKASLYKHFASKDALVAEYLRLRHERWYASFVAAVELLAEAPRARLVAVFHVLEEWFQSEDFRGCAFQNAAVELADRRHEAHAAVLANKRAVRAYLTELAAQAGLGDPEGVSAQLALLAEGAIITAQLEGSPAAARVARQAAETLLRTA